jgi:hypothetical protein
MKKNLMKTMVATVCVVATGMGGMKAYKAVNLSKTDMLFAENVEALSQSEVTIPCIKSSTNCHVNVIDANGTSGSIDFLNMVHK